MGEDVIKEVKAVIFDCDGVMFDTARANKAYYNHLRSRFGLPEMDSAQFTYVHMHTVDESLAHLFADAAALKAAQAYRATLDYSPFLERLEIEPGLKRLLAKLQPAYKTAIATNRTDTLGRLLSAHGLDEAFDMVVRACDVARPKPHPEPLLHILREFGIAPGETLYIGDSSVDEAAAAAARIPLVAYRNPGLKAARHIERLAEIEDLLGLI